jgi:membrane-associated protein
LPFVQNNFSLIVYAIIIISILPVVFEIVMAKLGKKKTEQDPGGDNKR